MRHNICTEAFEAFYMGKIEEREYSQPSERLQRPQMEPFNCKCRLREKQ